MDNVKSGGPGMPRLTRRPSTTCRHMPMESARVPSQSKMAPVMGMRAPFCLALRP